MAEPFGDLGGSSSSNPPAFVRWAMSKVLGRIATMPAQKRRRARAEAARGRSGKPHRIDYFHQVDDGYSHLAAQLLGPLLEAYDVELVCHLVRTPAGAHTPEPELLLQLSRYDGAKIAPHYGLRFPDAVGAPDPEHVDLAERILAGTAPADFPAAAVAVGEALWAADGTGVEALAERFGSTSRAEADQQLERGDALRTRLGHYSAAMFHCTGEWYWGADRFYHLENRLMEAGAARSPRSASICPRPAIETGPHRDDGSLTLEFYPSLRSPYTSMIFDKTLELAEATGVTLELRPVLPMVMRGVPAPRTKGWYIFTDTAREAHALGVDWGRMYDPIGEPVLRCYSLYPWACEQGRGAQLLGSFLRAAFVDGINTGSDRGLKRVVEDAGLSWGEAERRVGDRAWEAELEANRLAMYDFGSWGVPSYRLLDSKGSAVLAVWGQDRLWLVSREIQRRLREGSGGG